MRSDRLTLASTGLVLAGLLGAAVGHRVRELPGQPHSTTVPEVGPGGW